MYMDQKQAGEVPFMEKGSTGEVIDKEVSRTQLLLSCESFEGLYGVLGDKYPEYSNVVTTIKGVRDLTQPLNAIPNIPGLREIVNKLLVNDNSYKAPTIEL